MQSKTWILRLVLALACLAGFPARAAEGARPPVIPLNTTLGYWDRHWFVWLPRHPVYESVEVASRASPGGGAPQVWVWFTERAGSKAQVNYYSGPDAANGRPGALVRPIVFDQPGGARSAHVAFTDKDGAPVDLRIDVDPAKPMDSAGLTDQSGHASASVFLIFFRERQLLAKHDQVMIGGQDYSFNSMEAAGDRYRFMAAYSEGIYIATIPFGAAHVADAEGALQHSWGRTFVRRGEGAGVVYQTPVSPRGESVRLDADASGGLLDLVDRVGDHALTISFDRPLRLPPPGSALQVPYRIALDGHADLIRGDLVASTGDGAAVLDWMHSAPSWTTTSRLRSTLTYDRGGQGYLLVVSRLAAGPAQTGTGR